MVRASRQLLPRGPHGLAEGLRSAPTALLFTPSAVTPPARPQRAPGSWRSSSQRGDSAGASCSASPGGRGGGEGGRRRAAGSKRATAGRLTPPETGRGDTAGTLEGRLVPPPWPRRGRRGSGGQGPGCPSRGCGLGAQALNEPPTCVTKSSLCGECPVSPSVRAPCVTTDARGSREGGDPQTGCSSPAPHPRASFPAGKAAPGSLACLPESVPPPDQALTLGAKASAWSPEPAPPGTSDRPAGCAAQLCP